MLVMKSLLPIWFPVSIQNMCDLKLRYKLHGPMHYKIGVTCVYNEHFVVKHDTLNHIFHNSTDSVMHPRVSDQCSHIILFDNKNDSLGHINK